MTTLANDINIRILGEQYAEQYPMSILAGQTIYKGEAVIIDQSADPTGVVGADGVTCVDGDVFIGVAMETVTVPSVNAKATKIWVATYPAIVGFPSSVLAVADCGKTVYASAYTATGVTLSASNGAYPPMGTLYQVKDGYAFVEVVAPFVLNVP